MKHNIKLNSKINRIIKESVKKILHEQQDMENMKYDFLDEIAHHLHVCLNQKYNDTLEESGTNDYSFSVCSESYPGLICNITVNLPEELYNE